MAILNMESYAGNEATPASVKWSAILKVVSLFGFAVVLGVFLLLRRGRVNQVSVSNSFGKLEYRVPYKNTLYESFGFVQEPKVTVPLKTVNGYDETTFLLDSGAVVSTLPLQAAHDTGVDLAKAKRITLQGFSGVPAFAYLDKITIKIGSEDFEFPATFTESNSTTYILGRKGLFDEFTINFDHEERVITISKRS
ncbi:MAG: aspartyl protease family protein [Ignavibacteria bacterium]|nr:aspartyl protease family protein [Ignavibacteria bacterium]